MTFPEYIYEKFPHHYNLGDLPTSFNEDRWCQTKDGYGVHATTVENVDKIVKDGLKPREETHCEVWDDERIPHQHQEDWDMIDKILQCRSENVYLWDDYCEGVGQGFATVQYLGKGNPALMVVRTEGMELVNDPENESSPEEPVAYMKKGVIDPDKIACVCQLKEEFIPSVGTIACNEYSQNPCKEFDIYQFWEDINKRSNWDCQCRRGEF